MFTTLAIIFTLTTAPEAMADEMPSTSGARPSFGMGMPQSNDGLPPFEEVSDGYEKVISSVDGKSGMYTLYRDEEDHLLVEIAPDYEGKPILIAYTVSSGIGMSGV